MSNGKKNEILTLPNFITALRLAGTVAMLFIDVFSAAFYVIYTLSGISDVLDGAVARATGTSTEFGKKMDSAADMLFYVVMMVRVFPELWEVFPVWLWGIIAVYCILRIVIYVYVAWKYHCFASLHTYLNKLGSFGVFTVPYLIKLPHTAGTCAVVASVGLIGTIEELLIHTTTPVYQNGRKSIFMKKRG